MHEGTDSIIGNCYLSLCIITENTLTMNVRNDFINSIRIAVIFVVFFECVGSYRMTKTLSIGALGTIRKAIPDLCTCTIMLLA